MLNEEIITCEMCGRELDVAGALLYTSPLTFTFVNVVAKYHICIECEKDMLRFIKECRKIADGHECKCKANKKKQKKIKVKK